MTLALCSYEIVYRPTIAPLWTRVMDVGNVNYFKLDISKDNVLV